MAELPEHRWLLLIHQLPPKPDYFRVKIRRRLLRIGAVALKNTVYLLPQTEQTIEDFQWVLREITEGGGDAVICEAAFIGGLSDAQIATLFQTARDADYQQLAEEIRTLMEALPQTGPLKEEQRMQLRHDLARLTRRFEETVALDFFTAAGREEVEGLMGNLETRMHQDSPRLSGEVTSRTPDDLRGRTWVTRAGMHIDRITSAWLICRFIDPDAQFQFVSSRTYRPQPKHVRFDMFEAEFTHDGDRCTFEVLLDRIGLTDPALQAIAEIVHDIDLKDEKFQREEAAGIARLIEGLTTAHKADEDRLARGAAVFDDLYAYFQAKSH
jgi:hypothetical protein